MRKLTFATVTAAAALALTGCGTSIEDITADTPRETRDEVYAAYMEETYRDEFPNMSTSAGVDVTLRLCSVFSSGESVTPGHFDFLLEDLAPAERAFVQDGIYQGVRVYCPEHRPQVEFLRPVAGAEG